MSLKVVTISWLMQLYDLSTVDANQVNKEMPKNANLHNEKSSQSGELTRGRMGHRPEHLKFFLLVFLNDYKYV